MKPLISFLSGVNDNFTPIFVSGAPRSGTTVCHALLCTSKTVNDYIPESSFLTGMLNNFEGGLNNDVHNVELFGSKVAYADFSAESISHLMSHLWMRLKSPEFLCLKDPMMYKHFNWLHQFYPNVKYVFTIRESLETISSRVKIDHKQGIHVDDNRVRAHASELLSYYQYAIYIYKNNTERLFLIDYESILDLSAVNKLNSISPNISIEPDDIWKTQFMSDVNKDTTFITEKYGKLISDTKKSDMILTPNQIDIVQTICQKTYNEALSLANV
jgi:hypothetical protein